jgi:LuxR family maltose regulon positive regulatory protein
MWTVIMQITGQGKKAVQEAKKALKNLSPPGEPIQLTRRTIHPNFVYLINADLPSVKKSIDTFFKLPEISTYMIAFGWYFRGAVNWGSNKADDAITDFNIPIKYQYQCRPRIVVEAYICKALALQELKRPKEARQVMSRGVKFAEDTHDIANIGIMASGMARLNLLQNELGAAKEWLTGIKNIELDATVFWWIEIPAITHCRVLIALGTPKSIGEGLKKLIEFENFSRKIFNNLRVIEILLLQANAFKQIGENKKALKALEKALNLAADGNFIRPFIENGERIHTLYLSLKKQGVQVEFVNQILLKIEKYFGLVHKATELKNEKRDKFIKAQLIPLTRKEIEILQLISEGDRNRDIADKLFNSEETIKKHVSNMFQKFNVHKRLSLISKARELGMLNMHSEG